mgnify:CR=1 FL=1
MTKTLCAIRHLSFTIYAQLFLLIASPSLQKIHSFASHWNNHKTKIIKLSLINTSITTVSEFISRSVLVKSFFGGQKKPFIKKGNFSFVNINRQSLINILMTLFASLIAGPIFFFKSRKNRFLFFLSFGIFNSMLGQIGASLITFGPILIEQKRLMFDLIYLSSFKFVLFEFFRPAIILKDSASLLFLERGKQDFITTFFKTSILNLLGLKN